MKNNKTVWITGGGTGIGKSVAEQLADLGHNVIISGRRLQILNKVLVYGCIYSCISCFLLIVLKCLQLLFLQLLF